MKLKKHLLLNVTLALLASSLVFIAFDNEAVKRLELASLDLSFRLRGSLHANPHIVIIEVTDSDIAKVGRWPWKRSWHGALARALKDLGARSVYFDIVFAEPSVEEEDDIIFEAGIRSAGNVYLPFAFEGTPYDIKNAVLPLRRFSDDMRGTGAANIYADIDGTMRRVPLLFLAKDNIYPHAALKVAMDYDGLKTRRFVPDSRLTVSDGKDLTRDIPLAKNNQLLINWPGRWQKTFKHYSFLDVLAAYKDILDKKRPDINPGDFKDSVCIIGLTAIGLFDIKPVPLEPEYPGVGVVAAIINNILDGNFIYIPPAWISVLIIYALGLVPAFLISGEKPLKETLYLAAAFAAYFALNIILFVNGTRLELFTPLSALVAGYFLTGTYNFIRIAIERQLFFGLSVTDGLTGLYNIRHFRALLEREITLARSDPAKAFAVIMGDIDHFKGFNDTYGHQIGDLILKSAASILKNSVRAIDVVARYGGEEMIVLLAGSSLANAMAAAEKMRKAVEEFQIADRDKTYNVTVSFGVSAFRPGDSVESVIRRSDEGLYKSKLAGRNRVSTVEEL